MRNEGALLGLLLLAGCAATPPAAREAPAPAAQEEMARAVEELEAHRRALALPRAGRDCAEIGRLAELICRAGERICAIAGRHPEEPAFEERCRGAREDCARARSEGERCP